MSLRRRVTRRAQKNAKAALEPPEPLSATLFAFAKPMLDSMPTPRKLAHMKAAMALATLAWNLPLLERDAEPSVADAYRARVEAEIAGKPPFARALVEAMMKTRLKRWRQDDRLIASVEVVEDESGIRILASEAAHVDDDTSAPTA